MGDEHLFCGRHSGRPHRQREAVQRRPAAQSVFPASGEDNQKGYCDCSQQVVVIMSQEAFAHWYLPVMAGVLLAKLTISSEIV